MLFKPKWRAPDGSEREGKVWWWDAVVAGKRYRESTGVRDRHAAEVMAAEAVRRLELRAAGLAMPDDPKNLTAAALVEEYEAELNRRKSAPQHVQRTVQRLRDLMATTKHLSDVTTERLRTALKRVADTGVCAKTVNAYRVAANGFFRWLIAEERWESNPVVSIRRVREAETARPRRALTQDEVARLVAAAPPHRAVAYQLAATTGLRRSELAALTWADVDLDEAIVRVRPTTAKNRKEAFLPLPPGTVAALRAVRGDRQVPRAPVLRAVPHTKTLRKDLKAAGIAYVTPAGTADLHALRVSYGTNLARGGVSLVQAQKLMRHSTPALTANLYTKLQLDEARTAVAKVDVRSAPGTAGAHVANG
jgi:integrase